MMGGIIDCHSHILPAVDDGSASIHDSIAMLSMEAEQGIKHVLATPHFYAKWDKPERFLENRSRAEELLRIEMTGITGLPQISIGAEVSFFRGMSESNWLPELTITGGHAVLVEMPPPPWPDSMYHELVRIWEIQGIIPVIAHIDRYISPFQTHNIPERLAELPVLVQANSSFFLKPFTSALAMRMLKANLIHLLGSDCHNLTDRCPNLHAAVSRIQAKLGQDAITRIYKYQQQIMDIS